jgi:site-specific recombinase XerD
VRIFARHHAGPFEEVTAHDVDSFVDQQCAQGLAPATVKRRVASLKTFFDFVNEELTETDRLNPVTMRRHAGRQPRHLPRDLSDEEVRCLLQVVDKPRDLAMISLMLYAGLRVGEVVDLCAMDISVPAEPQAPIRVRVMGKGRKERVAYLYREGYQPVQQYIETQPVQDRQERIFRNRLGDPITVAGVQERIRRYAERSGVAVTCHRLRHTYGRWMAENEMPVLALSRLLGHASIETTQVYIDGADPQIRRSYEAAMDQSRLGRTQPETALPSAAPIERTGPATVVREASPAFDRDDWMPAWPDWLRESCLDWVRHK